MRINVANTCLTMVRGSLWVVITSISDPAVSVAGRGGDTTDGYKYIEISLPGDGQLDPAEGAGTWLYFANPLRRPFNFAYSIRGVIQPTCLACQGPTDYTEHSISAEEVCCGSAWYGHV